MRQRQPPELGPTGLRCRWVGNARPARDSYKGLIDRLYNDLDLGLGDLGSKVTILPSSIAGSPRAIKADMEDALIVI